MNSFLQGFTGGMGAANSLIDTAQQRQYRQQQMDDQNIQRNALSMMHIYNEFQDDPEKLQSFNEDMFGTINSLPAVQEALAADYPNGNPTLTGFEPTANGLVPMVSYTNAEGDQVTDAVRMDGSPVAISRDDFFTAIGSQPELVSQARLSESRLIGAGGQVPERPDQYRQEVQNGMLLNINERTNNANVLGNVGDGSGGSGGSGSGSGSERPVQSWAREDEDGNKYDYLVHNYNGHYVLTEVAPDGSINRRPYDDEWNQYQSRQGGLSVSDRLLGGMGGNQQPPPNLPGVGVLSPENLPAGMTPAPAPSSTPTNNNQEEETPRPSRSSVTGNYQAAQISREQRERAAELNREYKREADVRREEHRERAAEQRRRRQEALSNFRPGGAV